MPLSPKYDLDGAPQWTRVFGTTSEDAAFGVTVNSTGVSVVGRTDALPGQTNLGGYDAFVRRYDFNGTETGTLQFGTNSTDYAYGAASDSSAVYVCGYFLISSQGASDAFVLKLPFPPDVFVGGVVNNASFAPSPVPVAPGSIAAVFGTNLDDGSVITSSSFGPDGKLITTMGGASVTIDNIPAPMFAANSGQLSVQIPVELAGRTTATIRVTVGGQTSVPRAVSLADIAPGIFTVNQQGTGAGIFIHQDGITPVSAANPAHPGEIVILYATGLGPATPPLGTGSPSTGNVTGTPIVMVDGVSAVLNFSGVAPGFVGLNQVNLHIPPGTRTASNIPVTLTLGGKDANPVTIAVAP
ncbi:MAG: hypothetical protein HY236_13075 [Acidobacteria bacterium]|nr:hypothetical protein [Acidobacteriota bacterium]